MWRRGNPRGGALWARTELYFGTAKPSGVVSDNELNQFLNHEITPRFPDGLTVLVGQGQFRGAQGTIVQERSMIVILLYPQNFPDMGKKVEEIRSAYRHKFQQKSVLRVDSLERVSL